MPRARATSTYRGKPVTLTFAVTDPPSGGIGDWTLVFTLARDRNCATKIYTATPEFVSAIDGTFEVVIPADSTDIEPRRYWWDVWRVDEGEEDILAIGYLDVKSDARLPAS